MKRKKYADEQIAFALRQAGNGTSVEEVCRKLGVSEATFYWSKGASAPSVHSAAGGDEYMALRIDERLSGAA